MTCSSLISARFGGGYEGDAGATYVVGSHPLRHRCAVDAKVLYDRVKERWQQSAVTGEALYAFAEQAALDLGWHFTLSGASGHRLSDFPHALYSKAKIADLPFHPSPCRWVLEIQIRHPELPFGAFYEDLLL